MGSDGWHPTTLGDEVEILTGFPFKSALYTNEPDGIPLVRGDNVVQGRFRWDDVKRWSASDTENVADFFLQSGDVVLAMDRPWIEAGLKYACVSEHDLPCLLVQRVARLRAKERLDQGFLRYVIGSPAFTHHILGVQTGTAVPHISSKQIKEFKFLNPPLHEQRAIANILSTLDDKIELNKRMNETLESIAQALFKSWFVDFDPVRAKMEGRQTFGIDAGTAALFPSSFDESLQGLIPQGWQMGKLGQVIKVNERSITKDYPHQTIRYIDISSVTKGKLGETTQYALTEAPSRARRLVQHGDTIWSTVRPNRKSYLYVQNPMDNYVVSTGFAVLTPHLISPSYIYNWVTTQQFVDYLSFSADGSAYPAVSPQRFLEAELLLPPTIILEKFEEQTGVLYKLIAHNEAQAENLIALRDILLPKLMSGELPIQDAERRVETQAGLDGLSAAVED